MLTDETQIPWLVLYVAKNAPASATSVKTTLISDLSDSAMPYSELPWANIETPDAQSIDTSFTRRIAGNAEINISPIVAIKHSAVGTANVYTYPYRVNARYIPGSQQPGLSLYWYFDIVTSNVEKIGQSIWPFNSVLTREDINLTPSNNLIHWNDDGVIVPAVRNAIAADVQPGYGNISSVVANYALTNMRYKEKGQSEQAEQAWTRIKSYLAAKKASLETNNSHAPVPGQEHMEAYVGGNQSFMSASNILSYNGKLVQRGANIYRIKVVQQNKYSRPIDYFVLDGNNDIQPSSTNTLALDFFDYPYWAVDYQNPHIYFDRNTDNTMVETFFEHS